MGLKKGDTCPLRGSVTRDDAMCRVVLFSSLSSQTAAVCVAPLTSPALLKHEAMLFLMSYRLAFKFLSEQSDYYFCLF